MFHEWREFQKPVVRSGVPDYTSPAMERQRRKLPAFQRRLREIDPSAWPVSQQIDHWILRAEMNGLDFDHRVLRPRSRELVYILIANRAARGLAGHRIHSGEFTLEQAVRFAHEWTPYGWLKKDGSTMWGEQQLYLEQPGYGTSYLGGKAHIEKLIGERARQLGDGFTLVRFFEEFHAAGMIPVSLIRWEITGLPDEIDRLR